MTQQRILEITKVVHVPEGDDSTLSFDLPGVWGFCLYHDKNSKFKSEKKKSSIKHKHCIQSASVLWPRVGCSLPWEFKIQGLRSHKPLRERQRHPVVESHFCKWENITYPDFLAILGRKWTLCLRWVGRSFTSCTDQQLSLKLIPWTRDFRKQMKHSSQME